MIEPIAQEQQRQVLAQNERYVEMAEQLFKRQFARIPVLFDLSGRSAGMFKVHGTKRWIRYNPWIFAKYPLHIYYCQNAIIRSLVPSIPRHQVDPTLAAPAIISSAPI